MIQRILLRFIVTFLVIAATASLRAQTAGTAAGSENIFTPPDNRRTLIVQADDGPEAKAGLEKIVEQLNRAGSETVVFSPFEEKRKPTARNLQKCLQWIQSPDDYHDEELGLEPIRRLPDLPCELWIFINARGVVRDDQPYFSFNDADSAVEEPTESAEPDADRSIPLEAFLNALTYQDEFSPGVVERRLIVVNLLPLPVSRSADSAAVVKPLSTKRALDILRREKSQSEGVVIVQNQATVPPLVADNLFEILREGLAGRADEPQENAVSDGQVTMSELIEYIGRFHAQAGIYRSGRDFPLTTAERSKSISQEKPDDGLFLRLGAKLRDKKICPDDVENSFQREGNVVTPKNAKISFFDGDGTRRTVTIDRPFKILEDDGKTCRIITDNGKRYAVPTDKIPASLRKGAD